MTVSTAYEPITTDGDATTVAFPVTWPFFDGSLLVTLITESTGAESVKTISTHYTVSGGTDANGLPATGTVTMITAPATTEKLRVERVTPRTQAASFTNGSAFGAKTIEAALDKAHLITQEALYETQRAIKLKTQDLEAGVDPVLPLVTDNAGEAITINDDEDGVETTSLSGVTFEIGTVTTLSAGASATAAINDEGDGVFSLDLGIPIGATGAGSGDMLAANNLSEVTDATALTNLGVSAFVQTILNDADAATVRATIGAVIGTNVQAYSANLAAVAAVTVSAAGTALLDDANAAAQRTTLGLGTAAVLDVGTGASQVVQLTGAAKLPAVDGSLLTGVTAAQATGGIVQSVAATPYATASAIADVIPGDDTIPQIGEGAEIMTATIVPTANGNKLRIRARGSFTIDAGDVVGTMALFRDATANALAAEMLLTSTANRSHNFNLEHEVSAGSTSSTTFKIRIGVASSTMRPNGQTAARYGGGVQAFTMFVEEIKG